MQKKLILSILLSCNMLTSTIYPAFWSKPEPTFTQKVQDKTYMCYKKTRKFIKKNIKIIAPIAITLGAGVIYDKLSNRFINRLTERIIDILPFKWLRNLFKDDKDNKNGGAEVTGITPTIDFNNPKDFAPNSIDPEILQKAALISLKRNNPENQHISIPKMVIIDGPSHVGKSKSANGLAKIMGARKVYQITANNLEGEYVGSTAKNIRNIFEDAQKEGRKNAPSVIILDEIDYLVNTKDDKHAIKALGAIHDITDAIERGSVKNVYFITTTNAFDSIPSTLQNRFKKFNGRIKVGLPNESALKSVCESFARENGLTLSNDQFTAMAHEIFTEKGNFGTVQEKIKKLQEFSMKDAINAEMRKINKTREEINQQANQNNVNLEPKNFENENILNILKEEEDEEEEDKTPDFIKDKKEKDENNQKIEINPNLKMFEEIIKLEQETLKQEQETLKQEKDSLKSAFEKQKINGTKFKPFSGQGYKLNTNNSNNNGKNKKQEEFLSKDNTIKNDKPDLVNKKDILSKINNPLFKNNREDNINKLFPKKDKSDNKYAFDI